MTAEPNAMQDDLERAITILKGGRIVAYPTDTVYGLGADSWNPEAVARVFQIKRRRSDQPLPLLISDEAMLSGVATGLSGAARRLAGRFWPGGLTLVLPKAPDLPAWLASGNTVAVRIPASSIARDLIRGLGRPLIGTSANLSGGPIPVTAAAVRNQLGNSVDFVLDGGPCPGGIESTVVNVTGKFPEILREGTVSAAEIARVWGGSSSRPGRIRLPEERP